MTVLSREFDSLIRSGFLSRTFVAAHIEQRSLCGGMRAQLSHLVIAALERTFLFSLSSAFRFFPLFLLTGLFLLTFCER